MGKHGKRAFGRLSWVFLTQGPGSSVASIDEGRLASAHAFRVEGFKILCREIDLPANLHARGNEATEAVWDRRNRQNVRGDVLANPSVSTSCSAHQYAIFVEQIHCKTVDLDLGEHVQVISARVIRHAQFPRGKLFKGENIVQTCHLLEVTNGGKSIGGCSSHTRRRRVRGAVLRIFRFKFFELTVELVIVRIREHRRIVIVICGSSIFDGCNELTVVIQDLTFLFAHRRHCVISPFQMRAPTFHRSDAVSAFSTEQGQFATTRRSPEMLR